MCENCLVSLLQNDKRQTYALCLWVIPLVPTASNSHWSWPLRFPRSPAVGMPVCVTPPLSGLMAPGRNLCPSSFLPSVSSFLRMPPHPLSSPAAWAKRRGRFSLFPGASRPAPARLSWQSLSHSSTWASVALVTLAFTCKLQPPLTPLLHYSSRGALTCFLFFDPKASTVMIRVFLSW